MGLLGVLCAPRPGQLAPRRQAAAAVTDPDLRRMFLQKLAVDSPSPSCAACKSRQIESTMVMREPSSHPNCSWQMPTKYAAVECQFFPNGLSSFAADAIAVRALLFVHDLWACPSSTACCSDSICVLQHKPANCCNCLVNGTLMSGLLHGSLRK